MTRVRPPYRADHVGSLLRPAALLAARARFSHGTGSAAELRAAEDEAIVETVRRQESVGLRIVTDGEMRRESWLDFLAELDGVRQDERSLRHLIVTRPGHRAEAAPAGARNAFVVDGPIGLNRILYADDLRAVQAMVRAATPKLTLPSPNMLHYRTGRAMIDANVYPDLSAFWADLIGAYRRQIAGLTEAGCVYLQLDDTSLAYVNDPRQRELIRAMGGDPRHQHLTYIQQFNAAVAQRPADMTLTVHLCRGNFRSSWFAEGGYDFVAEALFGELDVDGFFLEFDDARSGGFAPLRFVPEGKVVVLGLVTTKRGALESSDALKRRIEAASAHVPLDQLCLSPQCGFASTSEGNALTIDEQFAKLERIVEVAAEVWG
jgi:5-methyltetrahydropteroyltriglutamate--homocysteine methyltransferase